MGAAIESTCEEADATARRRPAAPLRVEHMPADMLFAITGEWSDLCRRTMEPNIFLEPAFALPLIGHVVPSRRLHAILVWEDGDASRLVALLLVTVPGVASSGLMRGFDHEQSALGTPLLDRHRGPEAFAAILASLSMRRPRVRALMLSRLPGTASSPA